MNARRLVAAAALAIALVPSAPAGAQNEKPDYEAAKLHYGNAEAAAAASNWDEAIKEYGLAYEITRDPVLFFKLGTAHEGSGDCTEALSYYRRYLAEATPSEAFRAKTEARIAGCEAAGGEAAGGGDAGTAAGAPVDDPPPVTDELPPVAEEAPPVADELPPVADELPPTDAVELDAPTFLDEEPTWQRSAAWTSIGFAIAFGTAGAVLGLSASSREEDIDNLLRFRDPDGRPASFDGNIAERYDELVDEGERFETLSLAAYGVAGAATVAAVVFFALDAVADDDDDDGVGATITPTAGADGVGVSAGWRF